MDINIEQIADTIMQEISTYTVDIAEKVKAATDETAQELLENIKNDAPENTGAYKKHMTVKVTRVNAFEKVNTWYVKSPYSGLPHLLENGHAKQNGARTRAFPHIEKNEEKALQAFIERVEGIIKNGS